MKDRFRLIEIHIDYEVLRTEYTWWDIAWGHDIFIGDIPLLKLFVFGSVLACLCLKYF